MASVLIRNIDDDIKAKLQNRAKRNGHSLEAELRIVLNEAVVNDATPTEGFGTRLANLFIECGLSGIDLEPAPRHTFREPIDFSK
jgi:antitoxin FitA